MPRPPGIQFLDANYHIVTRGDGKRQYVALRATTSDLPWALADEVVRSSWQVFSWCWMPNHMHLLLKTPESNLSNGMQRWLICSIGAPATPTGMPRETNVQAIFFMAGIKRFLWKMKVVSGHSAGTFTLLRVPKNGPLCSKPAARRYAVEKSELWREVVLLLFLTFETDCKMQSAKWKSLLIKSWNAWPPSTASTPSGVNRYDSNDIFRSLIDWDAKAVILVAIEIPFVPPE